MKDLSNLSYVTIEIDTPVSQVWPQLLLVLALVLVTAAIVFAILDRIEGDQEEETLAEIFGLRRYLASCAALLCLGVFWLSRVADVAMGADGAVRVRGKPLILPDGAVVAAEKAYAAGGQSLSQLASERGWKIRVRQTDERLTLLGENPGTKNRP
jgi:hypothetical protein